MYEHRRAIEKKDTSKSEKGKQVRTYSEVVSTRKLSNEREKIVFQGKFRYLAFLIIQIDKLAVYSITYLIESYIHVLGFITQGERPVFEIQQKYFCDQQIYY